MPEGEHPIPRSVHPLEEVTIDDFEWSAELERLVHLVTVRGPGEAWAVRVRYRPRSTFGTSGRRWVRFLLVPGVGESFESAAGRVEPAIVEHFRRRVRVLS